MRTNDADQASAPAATRGPKRAPRSVREVGRRVARRSYALTRWRLLRRLARDRRDPVVVFCMGKTASSAVVRAVRGAVPGPVHKIHLLAPESVARSEAVYRRTDPGARPRHIFHAAHLMRRLPTAEHPWTVITIVRDPVARAASDFFQSGRRRGWLTDPVSTTARFERFAAVEGIPRTLAWFDEELAPTLGIDVFAHPFDPDAGYGIIETPAVRLLVLRQESLAAAPAALARFLDLPEPLALPTENDAATKSYAALYAAVVASARLPADVLDRAYDSRFATHFYSPTERDEQRARWTR